MDTDDMTSEVGINVKNYYEVLVFEHIKSMPDVLLRGDDFVNDVACMALNRIKPRYVREKIFLLYYVADLEWEAMNKKVADAVEFAIDYIQRHAKHE